MKNHFLYLLGLLLLSCGEAPVTTKSATLGFSSETAKKSISQVMDEWHTAAGNAHFEAYFSKMTEDAVFIGTDATENWKKPEFKEWSRPYFDRGKAWDFTPLERNIFLSKTGSTAWFDELLETQMGICRGSGVLVKQNGNWKIQHYVLSIAIPNKNVPEVTELKKESDSSLISKFKS